MSYCWFSKIVNKPPVNFDEDDDEIPEVVPDEEEVKVVDDLDAMHHQQLGQEIEQQQDEAIEGTPHELEKHADASEAVESNEDAAMEGVEIQVEDASATSSEVKLSSTSPTQASPTFELDKKAFLHVVSFPRY
jgi:hypothetical protein